MKESNVIHSSNTALLIIDMINNFDFNAGVTLAKKAFDITLPITRLKNLFNQNGNPIIYINDHYHIKQADCSKIIDHCKNEVSQKVIEQIAPDEEDYFLIKPKHSAFYGTALDDLLHQLHIKSLVITGIAGNICVLFTANDAYMREYQLITPSDCIASAHDQDNEFALTMMKNVLQANISSSDILTKQR